MSKAQVVSTTEVGDRLKQYRRSLGLSQRDIQSKGVTYAYISRIESGARRPSLEAVIMIARKLGMTGLELLTGKRNSHCPLCERGKD